MKLHLGCGKRYLPGYIHVDIDKHPHIDYYHDIKQLPMIASGSVDEIYTCGTLEYFDRVTEIPMILKEWRRILKPNGLLRISVPDFEGIVKIYKKYHDLDGIGILGPIFGRIEIETNSGKEILFHKTVYDFESLKKVLESARFIDIKRYNWKKFLPISYDDFSAAYVPHKDPNGIPLGLNVICKKE